MAATPDVLLLREPAYHLDLNAIDWPAGLKEEQHRDSAPLTFVVRLSGRAGQWPGPARPSGAWWRAAWRSPSSVATEAPAGLHVVRLGHTSTPHRRLFATDNHETALSCRPLRSFKTQKESTFTMMREEVRSAPGCDESRSPAGKVQA
jgi:hypothetical protein